MEIAISPLAEPAIDARPVEVVERKGIGHPDSICDGLAEQFSILLSRHYIERFGHILHHNVDKLLLCGGASLPAFGGGRVTRPIELIFAGQVTDRFAGEEVPIEELAGEATRRWITAHFHALDPNRHVKVTARVRPGSADLVELFERQEASGVRLSNDTSIGVGYAPLSRLERLVLTLEHRLNDVQDKNWAPARGQDMKLMAVRHGSQVDITLACAFVDRHLANLPAYLDARAALADDAKAIALEFGLDTTIGVNLADDPASGSVYLTVTGTSAESGAALVGFAEITEANCVLVSRIGRPVQDPHLVDIRVRTADGRPPERLRATITQLVQAELANMDALTDAIVAGAILLS
jgi:S-adenosylmethionine synthetase